MNIRNLAVGLLGAALLGTFAAQAQDSGLQSYDVELIIFRVNRPTGSPENWAAAEKVVTRSSATGDEEPATATTPTPATPAVATPVETPSEISFPALGVTQFKMNGIEDALRKGKNYQPLAHIGWTQPGYPLNNSPKFSLQSYLPGFLPEGVTLNGQASLGRGARLLHLTIDLTYQASDGQRYVLRETRRMKSTEKNYLDHPYFGVIALITPKGP